MEVYDPTNDQWTMSKAEMNIARTTHAVAVASGVLYAIGGDDGGGAPTFYDTVERFDPETQQWNMVASLNLARSMAGGATLMVGGNELMYVVGGYNDLTDEGWTKTVEVYNATSNRWDFATPMSMERQYLCVAVV